MHGLVTVRLENAPRRILDGVVRTLGPSSASKDAPTDPDLVVMFVNEIRPSSPLRLLGLREAGYDDSHFYLFDKREHISRLELDRVGSACQILCERDVTAIPLLRPIVSLQLLAKGYALLHSAAFVYHGRGVLVVGWQKGGKTETLLPFIARGATYLSDEWTIVGRDRQLRGLASMFRLWDWHLRQLPDFWERIRGRTARGSVSCARIKGHTERCRHRCEVAAG